MKDENWVKRKYDIHDGGGNRTRAEKRTGNQYLGCNYEED